MNRNHPAVKGKVHMKKDMPRTSEATLSNPRAPYDEDLAKVLQAMKQMADPALEGTSGVDRRLKFLKVFISLSPPQYAGNPDEPLEGAEWLARIKQCFDVSDVPDDLKVGFATYCLTGAAHHWWEFVKRIRDVKSITWGEFEELFLNIYFPQTISAAKREEFLGLSQGNMTVAQYASKFLELAWYARTNLVRSDELAALEFLSGLRPSIRPRVSLFKTYDGMVAAALRVEQSLEDSEEELFEEASGVGEKRPRKQYICHHCGEPGHIRPNCPELNSRAF
ncbi:uncharacterized protein LOC103946175 isoform X1 [Pyrus x bretschneideri]|uniref:uncharacterized protein LOC103946175 isoform X1 n=1 Tax=Pyrus x bretschneideri TaxID=225117 RepID=UPI00202DDE0C|nr:uncharacterized protein LOC103946175 isoform X1 [Pyrus x bretschneideri]